MHNSPGKADRDFFVFVLNAKKSQMNRPHLGGVSSPDMTNCLVK